MTGGGNLNIILNGESATVEPGTTVYELIESRGLDPNKVIVELNLNILKLEEWQGTVLNENDNLEVLRFVGGG